MIGYHTNIMPIISNKSLLVILKDHSKLGMHVFFDLPSTTNFACYLSDQEALVSSQGVYNVTIQKKIFMSYFKTFHGLNETKCVATNVSF